MPGMADERTPEQVAATEALEEALARVQRAYFNGPEDSPTVVTGWTVNVKTRGFSDAGNDQFHYTHLKRVGMGIDEVVGLSRMAHVYWDNDLRSVLAGECTCGECDDESSF